MKNKIFFTLLFISILFISCNNQNNVNIIGSYKATLRTEHQLQKKDNPESVIGVFNIDQINIFNFLENNTFERIIEQKISSATSYNEELTDEEILNHYSSQNHYAKINGTYILNGNKLSLNNDKIVYDNTEFNYQDFYKSINSFGPVNKKVKVKFSEDNKLIIENVPFTKIE